MKQRASVSVANSIRGQHYAQPPLLPQLRPGTYSELCRLRGTLKSEEKVLASIRTLGSPVERTCHSATVPPLYFIEYMIYLKGFHLNYWAYNFIILLLFLKINLRSLKKKGNLKKISLHKARALRVFC